MSPYGNNQNQPGPANGASPGLYSAANQNNSNGSQGLYNQNQSSSGYPGYTPGQPGSFPGQSYYSNQSPTHGQYPGSYGGPSSGQPVRLSPPPAGSMGGMMLGARIPHPSINSPNQNNIKTEAPADLKQQPGMYGQGPAQGYNSSSYGYNGYGTARPLVSPMSPHQGRLNISPGGPNLSPRDGPPNMSPHPSLYSHSQPSSSPGPGSQPLAYHGSYQAQYSEYFAKQQQASQSPGQSAAAQGYQGDNSDKLSDAQSNAGSVRSAETEPETGASLTDPGTEQGSLTSLTTVKKETGSQEDRPETDKLSSESDNDNKFTPKSESEDTVKTEAGSYFEQHKDFTLKANQTLIDGMNIDSIPELPEIPELKYEDVSEMNRLHHNSNQEDKDHKETPPGLSPDNLKGEGGAPLGRSSWEEGGDEEGFHDNMAGGWPHMQGRIIQTDIRT